ncbi:DUF1292 domain-containing protein [Alkaliphilus serpentinus]|uniref:UPF0473 protein F8153_11595 n=1 Tax=Alkaliphilus serpentinus TaxID=1482731 RepID=A0A833HMI3_9FIRM|nr:DUF1292 domain-containing protein [Alkaliphilus serpentinus]KAB3527620.1 DUF1292 domain-containing protein [Alkaliphilus serpentinus]
MEERDNIITLVDEEGNEEDFEIIMTLEVEDNEYAILMPLEGDEEDDAYIFKIVSENNDEYTLVAIEDDEEYENVVAAYEAIVDEEN